MKKILLPILLFVMLIPLSANAETCNSKNIKLESIELNMISGNAEEVTEASISSKKINLNLKFYDPGDSVEYNLKVRNSFNEDFYFNEESLKLNTDYLNYEFIYDNNSNIVEAGKTKTIKLRVKYNNKVPSEKLVNDIFNDTNTMLVKLSNKTDSIVNPKTGVQSFLLIFAIIVTVTIYSRLTNKKCPKYMIFLISTLILIPIGVYALCKVNIELNANIQIDGKEAYFLTGTEVNTIMKNLAGSANIIAIKYSKLEPNDTNKENKNIVSLSNSPYPIYMWFDNGTIYWWSEDKTPSLNNNASYMFSNLFQLRELETNHFDSSQTTNMANLFYNTGQSDVGITYSFDNLNTSNVTDMSNMFYNFAYYNEELNLNLNNWDTSKVRNMNNMFSYTGYHSKNVNIDVHEWNINSIENLDKIFDGAGWYADKFTLNIEGWDLRNYKNDSPTTYEIFGFAGYQSKKSIVNLNNFRIGKSKPSFQNFLKNSGDIKMYMNDWKFDGTTNISSMFYNTFYQYGNNQSKRYIEAKNWDISQITSTYNLFYQFCGGRNERTYIDLTGWKLSKDTPNANLFYDIALYSNESYIDLSDWDLGDTTSLQYIFKYIAENNESATINLTGWDTSNVTDMSYMFYNAAIFTRNINIIGIEDLNTSKVTDMGYMFREFALNDKVNWDLSKWDVSNVTNMNEMFYSIGRQRGDKSSILDLSNWDVSNVTEAYNMFSSMVNLRKIYATTDWDFISITDSSALSYFFYNTPQIVGGNGTTYQGVYDASMAKIDREGVPGFFTLKN